MLRLSDRQRTALGESLRSLANLMVTGFVFTNLLMQQPPSIWLIGAGIIGWLVLTGAGLRLIGER